MEQGLAGSTQNSNEANQVCYITPENPDADMTLEDTTEADLQAEQYAQPETLLGPLQFHWERACFSKKDCVLGRFDYIWIWIQWWSTAYKWRTDYGYFRLDLSGHITVLHRNGRIQSRGVRRNFLWNSHARGRTYDVCRKNVTVKAGKSVEISIVDADGNSVMLDNFNGYGGDNNQAENLVYINDQLFQLEKEMKSSILKLTETHKRQC